MLFTPGANHQKAIRKLSFIGVSLISILIIAILVAGCSNSTSSPTPSKASPSPATTTSSIPAKSNPPSPTIASSSTPTANPSPITASSPSPTTAPSPSSTLPASPSTSPSRTPNNRELIISSTTSTRDSGLMDVLLPIFQQKSGYISKPIYVGSGAAITMGQQGNADVLLVHSPAAELQFVKDGYGINRKLIMHNDFIIVGPASDPAGVKGMTSAVDALKKIATAKINFYSRGDNSGTDVLEKTLWTKAGVTVKDGSTSNPSWSAISYQGSSHGWVWKRTATLLPALSSASV